MIDIKKKQDDCKSTVSSLHDAVDNNEFVEIMAVVFDISGNPAFYYSGNWHSLAKASSFLNVEFTKHAWDNSES